MADQTTSPSAKRLEGLSGWRTRSRRNRNPQAEHDGWLLRKDGAKFWSSLLLSAVWDEQGRLRGFSNVAKDLTERRKTEQALRESEEYFRLLVESVRDYGVFMVATEGTVQSWNPGAQRLKGFRAHEVVGQPVACFFPPEEREKQTTQRLIDGALLNGTATYEGCMLRKGGERFWAMVTLSAVEDEEGQIRGLSNVARDLTERKMTEDALRESEERLRLLVDSVQDYGMFMLSPEGRLAGWSPGSERLTGHTADDVVGENLACLFSAKEVERGSPARLIARAAAEGRVEHEGWLVRKSGAAFWASAILSAIKGPDGQLRGVSVVMRDLTERNARRAGAVVVVRSRHHARRLPRLRHRPRARRSSRDADGRELLHRGAPPE